MPCSKCGHDGHYAPKCTGVETPRPPKPTPSDATLERRAKREQRDADHEARRAALLAKVDAEREACDAAERPWNHVSREGHGHGSLCPQGFAWRHTWVHDTTGERLVVTVPPGPCDGSANCCEGMVVLRRVKDPLAVAARMPTSTVEVLDRDGKRTAYVDRGDADRGGSI